MFTVTPRPSAQDSALAEGILQNLKLFEGVGRAVVRQAAQMSELRRLARGDIAVQRGQPAPGLCALAYGSLKIRLPQPHGDELVLRLVGPGETLAEAAALLGEDARLDAVALADSMLVVIRAAGLPGLLQRDGRLSRNLAATVAERTHGLLGELEAGLQRSSQRLACYHESIAEPGAAPGTTTARLPLSKTLLAARLGVKKETLSRLLHQLAARGLISVAQREIAILDRAALLAASSDRARNA